MLFLLKVLCLSTLCFADQQEVIGGGGGGGEGGERYSGAHLQGIRTT